MATEEGGRRSLQQRVARAHGGCPFCPMGAVPCGYSSKQPASLGGGTDFLHGNQFQGVGGAFGHTGRL